MAFDVCVSTRNLKTRAQPICSGQILKYWFCYCMGVFIVSCHISHLQATSKLSMWPRERENAGLNLTCASRVFLLESVVQHSFEIQGTYGRCQTSLFVIKLKPEFRSTAIARIDRLGQTRPTEGREKKIYSGYYHCLLSLYFRKQYIVTTLKVGLVAFVLLQSFS